MTAYQRFSKDHLDTYSIKYADASPPCHISSTVLKEEEYWPR